MYTEDRNLHYFREISHIPRKSFHEKAVVDYIQRFAEERGLRFQRDPLHNLIPGSACWAGLWATPPRPWPPTGGPLAGPPPGAPTTS